MRLPIISWVSIRLAPTLVTLLTATTSLSTSPALAQTQNALEDADKISIFETQADTYSQLVRSLVAQNKPEAALAIAERGSARVLKELLAKRLQVGRLLFNRLPVAPSNQSSNLQPSTLQLSTPTQPSNLQPPSPTVEQIRQVAKEHNATLVEYSVNYDTVPVQGKQQTQESELQIWVIQPNGEITLRRSDLKPLRKQNTSLADLVSSSREALGVRGGDVKGLFTVTTKEANQTKGLQQLYQVLIQPIADLLPKDAGAGVAFIPQKSLFLVPFPALQDKSGKYLIEQYAIFTAPSIQVLDLLYKRLGVLRKAPLEDVLVMGNPTMPRIPGKIGQPPQQLPPLPGTEQEAIAVAKLLNAQALTGNGATKAAILQRMPNARIIHLATHGLLEDVRAGGIPGALALAPVPSSSPPYQGGAGGVNGLLTAQEVLNLQLNAELVVLSAGETALGRITEDGVIGFSRSFMAAGVPSAIASLWSISDKPTVLLMTEFYKNLQQNPDKAQALRSAMLATMKQYPNPRDWAAFILIGEP